MAASFRNRRGEVYSVARLAQSEGVPKHVSFFRTKENVGLVRTAVFHPGSQKRIFLATEENVIAAVSTRNGKFSVKMHCENACFRRIAVASRARGDRKGQGVGTVGKRRGRGDIGDRGSGPGVEPGNRRRPLDPTTAGDT